MDIKTRVEYSLKSHKRVTIDGLINLMNLPKFSILRAVVELKNSNRIRVYVGTVKNGYMLERHTMIKLNKQIKSDDSFLFDIPNQ